MASSTRDPIAMAIPPRVMVFILKSKNLSVNIVTTKESGIANKVMILGLKLTRKIKTTITTITLPSTRAATVLSTEA